MPGETGQPDSGGALPTVAALTATIEKLVAALGNGGGASHSNELLEGLLHLDALLEDWAAAAAATNLISETVFTPLDELPLPEQGAILGSLIRAVYLQSFRAGKLLTIADPESRWLFEMVPCDETYAGHVGVVPEKSARVMRLFEIYAPDEASTFRRLIASRAEALEMLVDDVAAGMLGLPEVRATTLQSSSQDLSSARAALRYYIRATFPLSQVPEVTTYNVNVSGGVVGVIGDHGKANIAAKMTEAATERAKYQEWVREYLEEEGRDSAQAKALADQVLLEEWELLSPSAPRG